MPIQSLFFAQWLFRNKIWVTNYSKMQPVKSCMTASAEMKYFTLLLAINERDGSCLMSNGMPAITRGIPVLVQILESV